jgi:hypothetical protein
MLRDEYNFQFFVICHKDEIEIIEDEMYRWEKSNITYISTIHRNMNVNILYRYSRSSYSNFCDYYLISSIYFPLISESLIYFFLKNFDKRPSILVGNVSYGENILPKVFIKNGKGIFSERGILNFLYLTIMDEYDFKQIFSIDYPIDELFFHCLYFNTIVLSNFNQIDNMSPYIFNKDLDFLKYLYYENLNKLKKIQLKKIWKKLKNIENIMKEKK